MSQQFGQALPTLPRSDETAPIGDREIDRRQSPRAQNRAGDDDAGRRLLVDHQPSADRENGRLQQQAQNFRRSAKPAADITGPPAGRDEIPVEHVPMLGDAADHAHCRDRLGVPPACFEKRIARHGELHRAAGRMAGLDLGNDRQSDENDGAEQSGQADQGMKQKADRQIDRHPRQIKECHRAASGKKAAHIVQVANWLRALAFAADLQRQAHDRVIDPAAHRFVEAMADPHQDAAPDRINHALCGVQTGNQKQ